MQECINWESGESIAEAFGGYRHEVPEMQLLKQDVSNFNIHQKTESEEYTPVFSVPSKSYDAMDDAQDFVEAAHSSVKLKPVCASQLLIKRNAQKSKTKQKRLQQNDFPVPATKRRAVQKEEPSYEGFRKRQHKDDSQSCLLYTSPSPRDRTRSRMPSSA